MVDYAEWREILKDERLPAVVVDLDAFDRNVEKLASYLAGSGKTLRLATKSLRVPALIERVLKYQGTVASAAAKPLAKGATSVFQGLMCYAAEEVEFLYAQGFQDFLVAYPTVRRSDLAALRRVHEAGGLVRLVVDSREGAAAVATAMRGIAKPFPVVLDVDVSLRFLGGLVHLGVRRSPLRSAADVARLLDELSRLKELRVAGALAYEAQVAGLGDRNPFKKLINPFARIIRALSVRSVARARAEVARVFAERGLALELFNGGGTGSMNYAAREAVLTELSAGSGLLCSHLFDYYSNVQFEPACFFALQAARVSDPGYATCLGGGYIASGEPGWDRVPVPYQPRGTRLVSMEGAGEVQTPVRLPQGTSLGLGDPVLFRHAKAGELAERFHEYLLVSGGKLVLRAPTYRGLQRCFF